MAYWILYRCVLTGEEIRSRMLSWHNVIWWQPAWVAVCLIAETCVQTYEVEAAATRRQRHASEQSLHFAVRGLWLAAAVCGNLRYPHSARLFREFSPDGIPPVQQIRHKLCHSDWALAVE